MTGATDMARTAHVVGDRLVQLELDTAQPICDVCVLEAFDEDGPRVRVVVRHADGARVRLGEGHGGAADDEGAADLRELDALAELVWRRHSDVS